MEFFKKIRTEYYLAIVFFIALCWSMVFVNFTGDHADGLMHYLFARTAPKYPWLYFDLWAKPLFTLVASVFAPFGIQGMHFMNVVCAIFTGLLICSTARKFNLRFSWMAFVFVILTPVYFNQLYAAMTEPFFAFLLALVVYLFADKKYASAAFFASLTPFARQEGYFLITLMLVIYVLRRDNKNIPLLFAGTVFMSALAYVFKGDLFYLINSHPYTGEELYGHGDFFHFFARSEIIFGLPLQILLMAGLAYLLTVNIKKMTNKTWRASMRYDELFFSEFLLSAVFVIVFFMMHTLMWWQGWFSSLGLERVMACIIPLVALVALRGLDLIVTFAEKKIWKKISFVLLPLFSIAILITLSSRSAFPPREQLSEGEKVLAEAASWLNPKRDKNSKIYFGHPYNTLLYNINPKGQKDSDELMYVKNTQDIEPGAYVIWDSEFGNGKFPKERIMQDSAFVFLRSFTGPKFETAIFRKNDTISRKSE